MTLKTRITKAWHSLRYGNTMAENILRAYCNTLTGRKDWYEDECQRLTQELREITDTLASARANIENLEREISAVKDERRSMENTAEHWMNETDAARADRDRVNRDLQRCYEEKLKISRDRDFYKRRAEYFEAEYHKLKTGWER